MVEALALAGSVISVVGLLVVAVITQSGNRRTKRIETEAAPYEALAKRVTELEPADEAKSRRIRDQDEEISALRDEIAELRHDRDEDRDYIRRVLAVWSVHLPNMPPPQPYPGWYEPHPSQQWKDQR